MTELEEPRALPLREARGIADYLVELLRPACDRIEVAGSVRREKSLVNDLEIVAIPKIIERPGEVDNAHLFDPPPLVRVNALWERIEEVSDGHQRLMPIKPGTKELIEDPKWREKRAEGSRYFRLYIPRTRTKVDLFLPDADTWGAVFAIRTGSADFSRALVTRWTDVSGGGHVTVGRLCTASGTPVPAPEESDVFFLAHARYLEPRLRVDASSLKPL